MVHSDIGDVAWGLQLEPRERSLVHVEAPNIINRLSSSVASEYQQIWLVEYNGVAVAPSRRLANHWHDHPLGHLLSISQVKQVEIVRGQTASAGRSTIDDHLKRVYRAASVRRSRGRSNARAVQLLPLELHHAEGVGVARDHVLASVSSRSAEEDDLRLAYLRDGVSKASERHLSEGVHLLELLIVCRHCCLV